MIVEIFMESCELDYEVAYRKKYIFKVVLKFGQNKELRWQLSKIGHEALLQCNGETGMEDKASCRFCTGEPQGSVYGPVI